MRVISFQAEFTKVWHVLPVVKQYDVLFDFHLHFRIWQNDENLQNLHHYWYTFSYFYIFIFSLFYLMLFKITL